MSPPQIERGLSSLASLWHQFICECLDHVLTTIINSKKDILSVISNINKGHRSRLTKETHYRMQQLRGHERFQNRTGNTRVCDIDDYICLRNHYYSLHARRAGEMRVGGAPDDGQEGEERQQQQQRKEDTGEDEGEDTCICPPLCDEVTYDVHFSSGDLRATQFQRSTFFTDLNMTGRILFHFYFGNHVTIRTRRDVITSLGGVFSLFLGCSFMSLIEMVYFFTLHLALRYRRLAVHAHAYDDDGDDDDHGGGGGDGRLKESPLHPALRPLHLQLQLGARPLRPPYGARPHRGS
ncbi:Sodium channel protein Nach [Gryllus bimaculatus]|nr:Sodium channel protein Nach [Gryllus bimaculatus]